MSEQVLNENIEQKIQADVRFAIEGVDMTNLPDSLILVIEKVVKADRRRIYSDHAIELDQIEAERDDYKSKLESLKDDHQNLSVEYDKACQELKDQTAETLRLIEERDEMKRTRDNAAAQLEEANKEIARLKSEIEDYQKAKAFGEKEAQNIIDVTPNDADEINAAIKQFLTSEDWGSVIKATKPDGSFELVKRDEFEAEWAPIEPPTLGGSESTESFLGEDQAQDHNGDTAETEETTEPVNQFQAPHFPGTGENTIGGEVADETFEQEVRRRLEKLEAHCFAPNEDGEAA